jgi:hypothetical protein
MFLIFAAGVEGWKYCKRVYFRRRHASHPEEDDGMTAEVDALAVLPALDAGGKDQERDKRRRPLPADRRVPDTLASRPVWRESLLTTL